MLPTKLRVKKELFPEIAKKGSFLSGENVYIRFLDRKDNKATHFSFIVPVKVDKTSVGRHRIKRKMTAAVEKSLSNLGTGLSILIYAKKDLSALPLSQIEEEILKLLSKIKTLN